MIKTLHTVTVLLQLTFVSVALGNQQSFAATSGEELNSMTASRSAEGYSITINLTKVAPRTIQSIRIKHRDQVFFLPRKTFTDIKNPHLGREFNADDFRLEVTDSKVLVRVRAGAKDLPEDHAWILPLPLEQVRRITREANKTGYHEAHPSTPLLSKAPRAE
jgi:hypothetical protein